MTTRDICLNVLAFIGIALILGIGAFYEWKENKKVLAVISVIVAFFMLWEAWENFNKQTVKS